MGDSKGTQKQGGFPLRIVIAIILAIFALIVIVQNSQSAQVQFFGMSLSLPLWLLLVIFFLLGVLTSGLVRGGARRLMGRPPKDDD